MPAKRYRVNLTQDEREQLLDVARRGKSPARKVKRSLILCKADEGLTDQQIADALLVSPSTVVRVRQRFVEEGLERALNERARPGKKRKLDGRQEAHLVAVACTPARPNYKREVGQPPPHQIPLPNKGFPSGFLGTGVVRRSRGWRNEPPTLTGRRLGGSLFGPADQLLILGPPSEKFVVR